MKLRVFAVLLPLSLVSLRATAAETFDAAVGRATADYGERLRAAAEELNNTRARIAAEKAPLLEKMRAAEDRIIAADTQIRRMETGQEQADNQKRNVLKDLEGLRKTDSYLYTLVHEAAKLYDDALGSGEALLVSDRLQDLQQKLDSQFGSNAAKSQTAMDLAEFLLDQTELAVGGYTAHGSAVLANGNQVLAGTYAFVGPSTYFRPDQGGPAGAIWSAARTDHPVSYPLPLWKPEDAAAFFAGKPGTMVTDVTGGKALRLKETQGTVLTHINAGGAVAYVIIGVGFMAVLLIGQKILDLAGMRLDSPRTVQSFLATVATGSASEREKALLTLRGTTRELFTVGVQEAGRSKELLEEQLESVLLRQRLHYERRLPLLSVIATASPLMGLLGTVVGMVKTFALITVFGTGNAGKLASGISQVLVATELGLIVAIPTLIAHGFLTHRIHKNLSFLERYALDFVTAVDTARSGVRVEAREVAV